MTSLTSLIERIEAATEGSRELDVAVIMALYPEAGPYAPYCKGDEPIFWNNPYRKMRCPEISTSIDAALTLLPNGHSYACGDCNQDNVPWACVTRTSDGKDFAATGADVVLALLAAILRARQTEATHDES